MRELLTVIGPTPDSPTAAFPLAVREWCINTAAVNPATQSIFVPNEDGRLYRWNLATNSLSQAVKLTPGFGEPYVPTIIGPDGTVFTLNGGTLFAVGATGPILVTLRSSKPDMRTVVAGESLTFTASATRRGLPWGSDPSGIMVFTDTYYPIGVATPINSELARAQITDGLVSFTTVGLAAGSHLITATHESSGTSATLVQTVHPASVVSIEQIAETAKERAFFTPPAPQARHR